MMKNIFLATAFISIVFSCESKTEKIGVDAYKGLDKQKNEQKDLDSIGKEARQTFDDFKLALSMKDTTTTNFIVKEMFAIPNTTQKEHVWIRDVYTDQNNQLKGIVDNKPQYTKDVKLNDTIVIKPEEISDWMYYKGDKMIGGLSIKYMRSKLTDEERKKFDEQYKVKFE